MFKVFGTFGVFSVIAVVFNIILGWFILSAAVSGVKKHSDECGSTYKIERILDGNFFCEDG